MNTISSEKTYDVTSDAGTQKRTPAVLEYFERLAGYLELLGHRSNRKDIFWTLLDFVHNVINRKGPVYGGGGIFLLDEKALTFYLEHSWPSPAQTNIVAKEFEAQENAGIIGWCIREGKTVFHPSLILSTEQSDETFRHERNCFLMPLSVKDRIAGFLLLYTNRDEFSLKSSLTQILEIASTQTMLAADLYALNETLQQNNSQLEQLVTQRTAEIVNKNNLLNQQIKEIKILADAKLQFLAKMSHELRTPLTSILSSASLLGNIKLPPEGHYFIEIMKNSGTSLLELIDDLLDFSRLSGRTLELQTARFNLPSLLEELHRTSELTAINKDVSIRSHIGQNVPEHINTDKKRFQQIVLNLLNNAVKYTTQGWVEIAAETCDEAIERLRVRFPSFSPSLEQTIHKAQQRIEQTLIKEKRDCTLCLFSVADTGIGINENAIQTLFDAFVQEDSSNSVSKSGVGLGLAICKELTSAMKGEIGVSSQLGNGSVFWVLLPLEVVSREDVDAVGIQIKNPAEYLNSFSTRVLIVEDNDVNREMGKLLLEKFGCHVDEAADGSEAIEMVKNQTYDIVFMDCQMQRIDGYEASTSIRNSEDKNSHLPIVALTAHALESSREKCIKAGMDDFISKPITPKDLLSMLIKYVAHTCKKPSDK